MPHKNAERRLRQRIQAWQSAGTTAAFPRHTKPGLAEVEPLKLKQCLEEHRPPSLAERRSEPLPVSHTPRTRTEPELIFRAGQIWRHADRKAAFIVDFSDGEQIEIRWLADQQWGLPHTLALSDLSKYVKSEWLRPDWPLTEG